MSGALTVHQISVFVVINIPSLQKGSNYKMYLLGFLNMRRIFYNIYCHSVPEIEIDEKVTAKLFFVDGISRTD